MAAVSVLISDFAPADRLFHSLCGLLGPLDQALVHLYSAVLVALVTVAAIRWKSIAIGWMIKHDSKADDVSVQEEDMQRILLPLDRCGLGVEGQVISKTCARM